VAELDPPDRSGVSQTSDVQSLPASQAVPARNPPSGAVAAIRSIPELPPRPRLYRLPNGRRKLPPQKQHPRVPAKRVNVNWCDIMAKSAQLMAVATLRNQVCRRIVKLANKYRGDTPPQQWLEQQGAVYVIFHAKSSRFYVGETGRSVLVRAKEHWSARNADPSGTSALSQFFHEAVRSNPAVIEDCRVFVVYHCDDVDHRKRAEMDAIAFLRAGRCRRYCLNKTVPHGRRLRHRKFSHLAPPVPNGPISAPPSDHSGPPFSTYEHIRHLWLHSPKKGSLEGELHNMKLDKLKSLCRIARQNTRIRTIIQEVIEAKLAGKSKTKESRSVFTLPFGSKQIDNVQARQVLRVSSSLWPLADRHLKDCIVAKKLNVEAGFSFRNHTEASLNVAASRASECMCDKMPEQVLWRADHADRESRGHVLTTDFRTVLSRLDMQLSAEQLTAVVDIIGFHGAKFRKSLPQAVTERRLYACALDFAKRCHAKECDNKELEGEMEKRMKGWARAVTDQFKAKLYGSDASSRFNFDLGPLLEKVHKHFVITPVDKNPQSSAIWCRHHYALILDGAVQKSFVERQDVQPSAVIEEHRKLARALCHQAYSTLPYLYAMPKIHKLERHRAPFRFIVGKSQQNQVDPPEGAADWPHAAPRKNSLSSVRCHLAAALNGIIDLLVRRDNKSAIKRCWIVRDTQEFIDSVATMPNPSTFITRDFTTMYTNLDLEKVITGVNKAIDDVVDVLGDLLGVQGGTLPCGTVSREQCIYMTPDGAWQFAGVDCKKRMWSLRDIRRAVVACVRSADLLFDGRVYKQTSGIGMGHEECVGIANLYLYSVESRWVDAKINELGARTVIEKYQGFLFHRRFVDDLFAPGDESALPSREEYGLDLSTTYQGSEVVYLGVRVSVEEGRIKFRARDKQQAFDFKIVRFPSWESCVPKSVKRGTIMGMLCRTIRLTSDVDDLIDESRTILGYFRDRKYPEHFIVESVKAFLRRNVAFKFRAQVLRSLFGAPPAPEPPTASPSPTPSAARPASSPRPPSSSFLPPWVDGESSDDDVAASSRPVADAATSTQPPTPDAPVARRSLKLRLKPQRSPVAKRRSVSRGEVLLERREYDDLRNRVKEAARIAMEAARAAASSAAAAASASSSQLSRPNDVQDGRAMIEDVTHALAAAIQIRDRAQQPHEPLLLDAIRHAIEAQTASSNHLAQSISSGVHSALLDVVRSIRAQPQQPSSAELVLPQCLVDQFSSMSGMLQAFEQRLISEGSLVSQFATHMERLAGQHSDSLARIVANSDVQQQALIAQLHDHSQFVATFAQGAIADRTAIVQQLQDGWGQLHERSQQFVGSMLERLLASSDRSSSALEMLGQHFRAGRDCDHDSLMLLFQNQRDSIQHLLQSAATSQEGLLRQSQDSAQELVNSATRSYDALRQLLLPAVEHALAIESRPLVIDLRSSESRSRSEPLQVLSSNRGSGASAIVVEVSPSPSRSRSHAGSASLGRTSSDVPDRVSTARKASRCESADADGQSGVRVSSSTPFDARPAPSCERCGSRERSLRSVVVREVTPERTLRPDAESEPADPTTRLLICDRCDRGTSSAREQSLEPSVQQQQRDPSPDPRPPTH
jgi:hypothetical protein